MAWPPEIESRGVLLNPIFHIPPQDWSTCELWAPSAQVALPRHCQLCCLSLGYLHGFGSRGLCPCTFPGSADHCPQRPMASTATPAVPKFPCTPPQAKTSSSSTHICTTDKKQCMESSQWSKSLDSLTCTPKTPSLFQLSEPRIF